MNRTSLPNLKNPYASRIRIRIQFFYKKKIILEEQIFAGLGNVYPKKKKKKSWNKALPASKEQNIPDLGRGDHENPLQGAPMQTRPDHTIPHSKKKNKKTTTTTTTNYGSVCKLRGDQMIDQIKAKTKREQRAES